MPADNGLGLHEDQSRSPVPPNPREENPEEAIGAFKLSPLDAPLEDQKLVTEGEDLEEELGTVLGEGSQEARRERNKGMSGCSRERWEGDRRKIEKNAFGL
jgi:hypothetical protein